ncbi:MAG: bifunctional aldolase/short-chain dehydrogenase [Thermoplasmata archaeon]
MSDESRSALEERIRTSHLLGQDNSLVLHGGGNTSVKATVISGTGREVKALFIKSSGSDLSTIGIEGFTALDLEGLIEAQGLSEMDDEDMVLFFRSNMLDPSQQQPSVETFLHAFIPFRYVDHSHADNIVAITNTDLSDERIEDIFDGRVLVIPYVHPGFKLAKTFLNASRGRELGDYEGVILRNHGLLTWGNSADESYRKHLDLVRKAESYISHRWPGIEEAQMTKEREDEFLAYLPKLRGMLSKHKRKIITWNSSPEAVGYSLAEHTEGFQNLGPATPDMLVRTKKDFLFIESLDKAQQAIEEYRENYEGKYRKYIGKKYEMHDPYPNILVVRGYGIVTAAVKAEESRIIMDLAVHSLRVAYAAFSIGKNAFISERECFEMEYWPPQEAKLRKTVSRPLEGYIAMVTGAASGIGKVTLGRFAEEGMAAVGCDIDGKVVEVAKEISGEGAGLVMDISNEEAVQQAFRDVVRNYGGIDVVFNNAGYLRPYPLDETTLEVLKKHIDVNSIGTFLVTREAFRIMKAQGIGGVFIFNATKNVTHPGEGMMAYGSSKAFAAQLSRYVAIEGGKYGIRSNVLNPDKVFRESRIWEDGVLENRAKAKGVSVEDYKKGNLLHVEVLPEHVANVAVALIKDSIFGATTGAMIPIDGGVK